MSYYSDEEERKYNIITAVLVILFGLCIIIALSINSIILCAVAMAIAFISFLILAATDGDGKVLIAKLMIGISLVAFVLVLLGAFMDAMSGMLAQF